MTPYDTVSFEDRQYLARWVDVGGVAYLVVDESLSEKIIGRRLSKRLLKKLPDLDHLIYAPVEMLFDNEDVLINHAEMQLLESEYQRKYA